MNQLTKQEQEIIDLLRVARKANTGIYDHHILGNDPEKHRALLAELNWQALNGPGEDMVKAYGEKAVIKLTLLKTLNFA